MCRDEIVEDKKAFYKLVMGRDYPEEGDNRVKSGKKKQQKKKSPRKQTDIILRKSLRNLKTIDYKETSNYFDNKASSTSEQKTLKSKKTKSEHRGTNEDGTEEHPIPQSHKRVLFNCPMCELPMFSKENLKKHYVTSH